jgi:hypothetical protein
MRWFGWMLAGEEEIGKIVHELELARVRYAEGYEAILRRRVLALDLAHGACRRLGK